MSKPRALLLVLGLIAPALGTFACEGSPEHANCAELCKDLQGCGLLPSPFGIETGTSSAEENCVARCNLSGGGQADALRACGNGRRSGNACNSAGCRTLTQCLLTESSGSDLFGELVLTGIPLQDELSDMCKGTLCESGTAADCNSRVFDGMTAEACCTQESLVRAVPFMVQRGKLTTAPEQTCEDFLLRGTKFSAGVEPGTAQVGVEFQGTDGSTPVCVMAFSPIVPVTVSRNVAPIGGLQQGGEMTDCESGAVACANGTDDDGDTLIDCEDPSCNCSVDQPDAGPSAEAGTTDGG